jgi:hypothetical protein
MYRMFCLSVNNYLEVNDYSIQNQDFRSKITESIKILADIDMYNKLKESKLPIIEEVENLVFQIGQKKDIFPSFNAFSWELEGYGFDKKQSENINEDVIFEQLKLIDLLLSCHYWSVA